MRFSEVTRLNLGTYSKFSQVHSTTNITPILKKFVHTVLFSLCLLPGP